MQIVEGLPCQLACMVLQPQHVNIMRCVRGLPKHLLSTVLKAQRTCPSNPSSAQPQSIDLSKPTSSLPNFTEGQAVVTALGAVSQLTSLSLSSAWYCDACFTSSQHTPWKWDDSGMTYHKREASTRRIMTATFSSLIHLETLTLRDGITTAVACALATAAPHLTALASLAVQGSDTVMRMDHSVHLRRSISALPALKSFSFDGYPASGACSEALSVQVLVAMGTLAQALFSAHLVHRFCKRLHRTRWLSLRNPVSLFTMWYMPRCPRNALQLLQNISNLQLVHTVANRLRGRVHVADGIRSLSQITSLTLSAIPARTEPALDGERPVYIHTHDGFTCPLNQLHQLAVLRIDGYAVNELQLLQMSTLTQLRELRLTEPVSARVRGVESEFFTQLAYVVSRLRELRRLDLCNWCFQAVRRDPAQEDFTPANLGLLMQALGSLSRLQELRMVAFFANEQVLLDVSNHLTRLQALERLSLGLHPVDECRRIKALLSESVSCLPALREVVLEAGKRPSLCAEVHRRVSQRCPHVQIRFVTVVPMLSGLKLSRVDKDVHFSFTDRCDTGV